MLPFMGRIVLFWAEAFRGFILTSNNFEVYGAEASLYQEELPMTFCIFAFASDGWVMAADRAEIATWGEGTRVREAAKKIRWDNDARVAACYAGDTVARSIAEDIVTGIRQGRLDPGKHEIEDDRRLAIEEIGNRTLETEKTLVGFDRYNSGYFRTILVVLPSQEVWKIQGTNSSIRATLMPSDNRALFIGDRANPAVFFPQRYYSAFNDNLRSVDELIFFAGHSVLEAHFFNRHAIEGLNMLTYKRINGQTSQFRFYEDSDLVTLKTKSVALSEKIAKLLFAPSRLKPRNRTVR
jgi:hypothetical protein